MKESLSFELGPINTYTYIGTIKVPIDKQNTYLTNFRGTRRGSMPTRSPQECNKVVYKKECTVSHNKDCLQWVPIQALNNWEVI